MLLGARPAEGQARKAFVALSSLFSTQRQQQIQLIQYLPPLDEAPAPAAAAAGTAPPAAADDAVNSFEIVVNETVHLMKSFRLGGGQKEWLLVAGKLRKENDADSTDELQFSIYATTKDDRKVPTSRRLLCPACGAEDTCVCARISARSTLIGYLLRRGWSRCVPAAPPGQHGASQTAEGPRGSHRRSRW